MTLFLIFFLTIFLKVAILPRISSLLTVGKIELEINEKIAKKYKQQSYERHKILNERIEAEAYGILYNALVPEVFCKNLIRIGSVGDGGKWACNPVNMLNWPKCTIYSLGMNNDPSFEETFSTIFKE
uniref:Methyltransferase domain-containing protein n=1 Tax=Panagrolaimus superbus TaxID=310955 RepID=A0A914XYW4_9BILA